MAGTSEAAPVTIIGFDLGHGESCLTKTTTATITEPRVLQIQGQKSILSVVGETASAEVLIGEDAKSAPDLTHLWTRFKSRNFSQEAAMRPLSLFVRKLMQLVEESGQLGPRSEAQVVVGCPSGWTAETRTAYARLLQSSGIPYISIVAESRAAFLCAREAGDFGIPDRVLSQSILIVDIGSSTTDFTLVVGLKEAPLTDFGSDLGAGLLDELILNRSVTAHPQRQRLEELFREEAWVKAKCELVARRAKEMFFAKETLWSESKPVHEASYISGDLTFSVHLRPSDVHEILDTPVPSLHGRSWKEAFEDAVTGARKRMVNPPQLILLTGGASRMAFTEQICGEVFAAGGGRPVEVLRGAEPEFTIAKGLAYAGRIDWKTRLFLQEVDNLVLSDEKNGQIGPIEKVIQASLPTLAENVAEIMAKLLTKQFVLAAVDEWRKGKIRRLADLREHIATQLGQWLPTREAQEAFAPAVVSWFERIRPEIERLTNPICDRYQIPRRALQLGSAPAIRGDLGAGGGMRWQEILGHGDLANILIVILSLILAALSGGTGMALLVHGPIGWIVGFVAGAAGLYLGKEKAISLLENTDVPSLARKVVVLSYVERKLDERIPDIRQQIENDLENSEAFRQEVTMNVSREIGAQLNKFARTAALEIL
jgi:hypothetical protein